MSDRAVDVQIVSESKQWLVQFTVIIYEQKKTILKLFFQFFQRILRLEMHLSIKLHL